MDIAPALPQPGRPTPIRVPPEVSDHIRRGRRRLAAEADTDLADTALLAQYITEGYDDWIETKIARVRQEQGREQPKVVDE